MFYVSLEYIAERLLFPCTTRSLRPQQDVLSDCTVHNICCSVCQKSLVFSIVCRSLGCHGSEGRYCFQNEGIKECGRSDRMPSRLNIQWIEVQLLSGPVIFEAVAQVMSHLNYKSKTSVHFLDGNVRWLC